MAAYTGEPTLLQPSSVLQVEADPAHDLTVDLKERTARYRNTTYKIDMPEGPRTQLLEGTWDGTRVLLDAGDRIRQTADRLPYVRGFA